MAMIMAQAGGSWRKAWMAIVIVGILISSLEPSSVAALSGPPLTSGGLIRSSNRPTLSRFLVENLGIVTSTGESGLARNGMLAADTPLSAPPAPPPPPPPPPPPADTPLSLPSPPPPSSPPPPQDPGSTGDGSGAKASTSPDGNGGEGISSGAKAGIAIGVIFGVLIAAGAFFILRTRRNNSRRATHGGYSDPDMFQTL